MGLSFTIAAGPRQRSHSQVRIPRGSWPHFNLSDSRLPQPGGQDLRIYIPQEQGVSVIPQALDSLVITSYDSHGYGGGIRPPPPLGIVWFILKVKAEVMLRPTVNRRICRGIKHPCGAYDQIFITVRQLRVSWCGAPSLTRGGVCLLQCTIYLHFTCYYLNVYTQYIQGFCQSVMSCL
jgi:hypothetical protein